MVLAIIYVESGLKPYEIYVNGPDSRSYSPKTYEKAVGIAERLGDNIDLGLMQINYRWWGKRLGLTKAELLDPAVNVDTGCYILSKLLKRYHGNYVEAVKHYNSGDDYRGTVYLYKVVRVFRAIQQAASRESSN